MRPILIIALILISSFNATTTLAQIDTIYLDKYGHRVFGKDSIQYFEVRKHGTDGIISMWQYDINTSLLSEKGQYIKSDSFLERTGRFYNYDVKGKLYEEGEYIHGRKNGEWINHRSADSQKVWYTVHYYMDTLDGVTRTYYESGKLKRDELYDKGALLEGKCFAEDGSEIPYTPLQSYPKPDFDLNKFLSKNIKYPAKCRENKIQGRVVLKFVINEDGKVSDVSVVKAVDPLIDKEAIRVLSSMPQWIPGQMDDKPVKVYYNLPVKFALQ